MDLNPQRVRSAEFKTAKRGLDPEEVRRFLGEVADSLESAQNQSTAMEARARAAVARLQELSDGASSQASTTHADEVAAASAEQAETISRTLLLAQRTADTTIAQAEAESQRLVAAASEEAAATLDSTREMAARLMEEAREEARRVGEAERLSLASQVDSLKARRDFLESDVDHLEQFLAAQRDRLRGAAAAMIELSERVPNGLGEVRRPLVSAADDDEELGVGEPGAEEPDDGELAAAELPAEPEAEAFDEPAAEDEIESATGSDQLFGQDVAARALPDESGAADGGADDEIAEIGEFPEEDSVGALASDGAPEGFELDDVTGDGERPESGEDVRFSFDDRR